MDNKSDKNKALNNSSLLENNKEESQQQTSKEFRQIEQYQLQHEFKTIEEFVKWRDDGGFDGWYFERNKQRSIDTDRTEYYGCLTYGCSQKMHIMFSKSYENSVLNASEPKESSRTKNRSIFIIFTVIGHDQELHNAEILLTSEMKQRIAELNKSLELDAIHPQLVKEFGNDQVPPSIHVRYFAKKSQRKESPSKLLSGENLFNYVNNHLGTSKNKNQLPVANKNKFGLRKQNNGAPADLSLKIVGACLPTSSKPATKISAKWLAFEDDICKCGSTQNYVSKKITWFSVPMHKNLLKFWSLNSHDFVLIVFECTQCKTEKHYTVEKGRKGIVISCGFYSLKSSAWAITKKRHSFVEIEKTIKELDNDYKLLTKNCKHFCRDFYGILSGTDVTIFGLYFKGYATTMSYLCQDIFLLVQFYRRHFYHLHRLFFTNKAIPYKTLKYFNKFQKLSEFKRFKKEYEVLDKFWLHWEPLLFWSNPATKVRMKGPRGVLANKFNYVSHKIFNFSMILWHFHLKQGVQRPLLAIYKILPEWLQKSISNFYSFGYNFPNLGMFNVLYKTTNLLCGISSLFILVPIYYSFPSLLTTQGQFILRFKFSAFYTEEQLNTPIIKKQIQDLRQNYKDNVRQNTKYLFEVCQEPLDIHLFKNVGLYKKTDTNTSLTAYGSLEISRNPNTPLRLELVPQNKQEEKIELILNFKPIKIHGNGDSVVWKIDPGTLIFGHKSAIYFMKFGSIRDAEKFIDLF